ncbi:MAG: zinc-ribbon domain containing protein [Deltaproteobacteria bacterium]|nr:zinc-ribbon domain containing protein [Deltaproteobacteria bacterium]
MTETAQDIEIVCQDCGESFIFTGAEAAFYQARSLSMPPKRCKECRGARGRPPERSAQDYPTGNPNEYRSPMACETPGTNWARPSTPSRARPRPAESQEYRSPAFRNSEPMAQRAPRMQGNGAPGFRRRERPMFQTICAKCGATAHVPFEPSPSRQVLCKGCFDEKRGIPPTTEEG